MEFFLLGSGLPSLVFGERGSCSSVPALLARPSVRSSVRSSVRLSSLCRMWFERTHTRLREHMICLNVCSVRSYCFLPRASPQRMLFQISEKSFCLSCVKPALSGFVGLTVSLFFSLCVSCGECTSFPCSGGTVPPRGLKTIALRCRRKTV